jgi:hypothetical protein
MNVRFGPPCRPKSDISRGPRIEKRTLAIAVVELEKDLSLIMRPRSKFDRLVLAEILVEAGLILMNEAETSPRLTSLARARQVRNGLMMALLGMCPIRPEELRRLGDRP